MKELGTVQANLFDEFLIVSLDKKWINIFGRLPVFRIIIDDQGRLCLQSQVIKSRGIVNE